MYAHFLKYLFGISFNWERKDNFNQLKRAPTIRTWVLVTLGCLVEWILLRVYILARHCTCSRALTFTTWNTARAPRAPRTYLTSWSGTNNQTIGNLYS